MFWASDEDRVFLFTQPCDMRCSFDRLSEYVKLKSGASTLRGDYFVFLSRGRDRVKILHWEKDGYWLHYKRLEAGTFKVIFQEGHELITGVDLELLLSGMELTRIKLRKSAENGCFS